MDYLGIRNAVREVLPPFLFRWIQGVFRAVRRRRWEHSTKERPSGYYDGLYDDPSDYHGHYTASRYYFFWTVVVDRVRCRGISKVLEIGCGPGQLAQFLSDAGIAGYLGVDFSRTAIALARRRCPDLIFEVSDVLDENLLETAEYDLVIALEVLEHIERDLDVVAGVRPGAVFIGSVPDFPYPSHVRHFSSTREVEERYAHFFTDFTVDPFVASESGRTYFLMQGTRR